MNFDNADIKKLLPLFMRDDQTVNAIAQAVNDVFSHIDADKLRTWDQLEKLTHEELDDLAWELNVLWYNAAGTKAKKIEQIKTSDAVWRTLGTRYAVETVITQIFGSGELREFWEYEGGKPHHFQIDIADPSVLTAEGEKEFLRILEIVKRKSQILDKIRLVMQERFSGFTGLIFHEISNEVVQLIGQPETQFIGPYVFGGVIHQESTREIHKIP